MSENLKAPTTSIVNSGMMRVYLDRLCWLNVKEIGEQHYILIKRRCTFVPKKDKYNLDPEPIYSYEEKEIDGEPHIGIGIGYYNRLKLKSGANNFIEIDNRNYFSQCSKEINVKLRDNQHLPIRDTYKEMVSSGTAVLDASTGIGKTIVGQVIRAKLGLRAVLPFHKSALILRWKTSIREFEPNAKVGIIGTLEVPSVKDPEKLVKKQIFTLTRDCDYCLITYQSLYSKGLEKKLIKNGWTMEEFRSFFSMQIFDEVHRVGAKEFSRGGRFFYVAYKLGLSGTLDRKNGCAEIIHFICGETAHKAKEFATKKPRVFFVNTGFSFDTDRYPNMDNIPRMRYNTFLAKIQSRNMLIASKVIKALDAERRILVFAQNHVLINEIYDLVRVCVRNKYHGSKKVGIFTAKHSQKEQDFAIEEADVSIVSKVAGDDGIDFERFDTCFIIDLQGDVRQMVGRILRFKKGKLDPFVLYFYDNTKISNGMAWASKRGYIDKAGWENSGLISLAKQHKEKIVDFKGRKISSPTVILRKKETL